MCCGRGAYFFVIGVGVCVVAGVSIFVVAGVGICAVACLHDHLEGNGNSS